MAGCQFPAQMITFVFMATVNSDMAIPHVGKHQVQVLNLNILTQCHQNIQSEVNVYFCFFNFRCDSGYTGPQCEEVADFNILYVVPSGQKLHYVLIAAIIGAVQIAIIVAVVMCITRLVNNEICKSNC